jgi:predicted transcriptional regulator
MAPCIAAGAELQYAAGAVKRVTVQLEDDLHRRLRRVVVEHDWSLQFVVPRLIESWVEQQEAEDGRAGDQSGDRAAVGGAEEA